MLVAEANGVRVEAWEAIKGPEYRCPGCREVVVLKQGRIVIHHFAHKPPVICSWGTGETPAHREAKKLFQDEFRKGGVKSEVEYVVPSLPGDRRADVIVWSRNGGKYAIELQHTSVDFGDLEKRTKSYIDAGVRVIWIPFLPKKVWKGAKKLDADEDGNFLIRQFSARPMDKWIYDLNFGEYWTYDTDRKALWRAKLSDHQIYVNPTSWYDSYGDEQFGGGGYRTSLRWRESTLWGPYRLDQVGIVSKERKACAKGQQRYPGGKMGTIALRVEQSMSNDTAAPPSDGG